MTPATTDLMRDLASRYIWWQSADDAIAWPDRIIAQVMNLGDHDDVLALIEVVGEDRLRGVLRAAEIGQLNPKSWAYWHYRLGLIEPHEAPPPMPQRILT